MPVLQHLASPGVKSFKMNVVGTCVDWFGAILPYAVLASQFIISQGYRSTKHLHSQGSRFTLTPELGGVRSCILRLVISWVGFAIRSKVVWPSIMGPNTKTQIPSSDKIGMKLFNIEIVHGFDTLRILHADHRHYLSIIRDQIIAHLKHLRRNPGLAIHNIEWMFRRSFNHLVGQLQVPDRRHADVFLQHALELQGTHLA